MPTLRLARPEINSRLDTVGESKLSYGSFRNLGYAGRPDPFFCASRSSEQSLDAGFEQARPKSIAYGFPS